MSSFNVLREAWIPVERNDGIKMSVGLLDLLEQAHELKDVVCGSPLENYAVMRLLIAFLMDAIAPESTEERKILFQKGSFSKESLEDYVTLCKDEGCSFDLFDEKRPFMQAAFDEKQDANKEKPIAALVHTLPSGNNHIHFDHRYESEHELTCAEALRALCAAYVFCTSGLSGPSSVNNTPCAYILCEGSNLFETLVLGMLSKRECGNIPWSTPPIAWRNSQNIVPKKEVASMSILAAFTWMPRRVTLIPDAKVGIVSRAYIQPGLNFLGNGLWSDPHVAYRQNKKGEWFSLKPQVGRDLWRDVGMLAAAYEVDASHRPPVCVSRSGKIIKNSELVIGLEMVGLVTNQAQYVSLQYDRLAIPRRILEVPELGEHLQHEMMLIELVAQRIQGAYSKLEASVAQQLEAIYFEWLYEALFREYLPKLAICNVELNQWNKPLIEDMNNHLKKALLRISKEASFRFGYSAKNILKVIKATDQCMKGCFGLLKERSAS